MAQQNVWKEMVRTSFRQSYKFPKSASHTWFPGHMQKGLKSMQRRMRDVDCVLEIHEARIPLSGRNLTFRDLVGGARPHLPILNKADLIPDEERPAIEKAALTMSPHVNKIFFTKCRENNCEDTAKILPTVADLIGTGDRFHNMGKPDSTVLVIGIPNVGKSSIINKLRQTQLQIKGRPAPVAPKPGWTKSVGEKIRVSDRPLIYLLDTPGISVPHIRDMHMGMKLAVCATLHDHLVGADAMSDYLLWWLNSHSNFSYVEHMGLKEPEDLGYIMLAKSAISLGNFITTRDISKGSGKRTLPDMRVTATRFLEGFRKGVYGKINLDCDQLETLKKESMRRGN